MPTIAKVSDSNLASRCRQAILPFDTVPEWAVVLIAITISGILFVAITAVHRIANQQR